MEYRDYQEQLLYSKKGMIILALCLWCDAEGAGMIDVRADRPLSRCEALACNAARVGCLAECTPSCALMRACEEALKRKA